jgi:GTP-binding protein EngB required for normal cell division
MTSLFKDNFSVSSQLGDNTPIPERYAGDEPLSIDEIIDKALTYCDGLPHSCTIYVNQILELKTRLARGKLHLAVLGQFNRGKSTFLNALIGMKVLPTSVLPITSVPTVISYDDQISCRVRFLDQKPDLVVKRSLEAIRDTLKKYVAEENNPNNQLCVKEVEVTCPSPLLGNGTVLLDTPGFGSTHLHNTRAALTVLTECDAAIFLLSADPPLTQTELEFLKQVNLYVPRIFFVVNKIDLLTKDELMTIDRFIKNVLVMQLKYPADLELFHICARKGELAAGDAQNQNWVSSGMNIIKTEVLDFMVKEKYFILAQALNEKFLEALNGIDSCLTEEIQDFKQPVTLLQSEHAQIQEQSSKLIKTTEKEIALIPIEESAVTKFLEEQITAGTENLKGDLVNVFDELLSSLSIKSESINSLSAAFSNIIREKLKSFYIAAISSCNKPIRKAVQIHLHEFRELIENVRKALGENVVESVNFLEKIAHCEIECEQWGIENAIDLGFTSEWADLFRNRSRQQDRYKKLFKNRIDAIIPLQLKLIEDSIKEQIHATFIAIHELLEKDYGFLIKLLEQTVKKKDTAIKERISNTGNKSISLQKTLENFNSIRKMLS